MNKQYRQTQILKLIQKKGIHTQEELSRALAAQGIQATQVTLSRDIKDLGLVKSSAGYTAMQAATPSGPSFETLAAEFLTDVRVAQNLVVLKTSPGNASGIAAALDREDWPQIVGTLAGDDTILIITPDNATAEKLGARLRVHGMDL